MENEAQEQYSQVSPPTFQPQPLLHKIIGRLFSAKTEFRGNRLSEKYCSRLGPEEQKDERCGRFEGFWPIRALSLKFERSNIIDPHIFTSKEMGRIKKEMDKKEKGEMIPLFY